jgi:hypothetical protein
MTSASSFTAQVTQLLMAWSEGDQSALETLTPLVQEELHRLAHHYMEGERPGHTLQTTALINEAYLRLTGCFGRNRHAGMENGKGLALQHT